MTCTHCLQEIRRGEPYARTKLGPHHFDAYACERLKRGENTLDFTRATEYTPEVAASINDAFEYHAWTQEMIARGTLVRKALVDAVAAIVVNVPPGADRSTAIRKIREARMDANSAITHGGKY